MRRPGTAIFVAALIGAAPGTLHAEGVFPNWGVDAEPVAKDELRLRLSMNRIHIGGAGEARLYFLRRAEEIARDNGYRDVLVLKYSEGVDSRLPFAQRYAEGVIRLIP